MNFPNKTAEYLYNISVMFFCLGLPNFWIEDLNLPKLFVKVYTVLMKILNIIVPIFIFFECIAFHTQKNLSTKQATDLITFSLSHPILWSYNIIMWRRDKEVKQLFSHIIKLKSLYNNERVEEQMLKKSNRDLGALLLICLISMATHTTGAFLLVFTRDGTFTTVITIYPLVEDKSACANVVRISSYVLWWVFASRTVACFDIVISLTNKMSFQYKNLQSYFYSLADIFEDTKITQRAKERKYVEGFKFGINLHLETIEGINQFRNVCGEILSGQIVFLISVLVVLMTQMMRSERNMVNAATTAMTSTAVLISTGYFFWNAGDITEEASKVPTAMYFSGWHNCFKNTTSVRKLVVIAMNHAQKPVTISGLLGIMTLSHQSFLSLVKFSYSVFSVIY